MSRQTVVVPKGTRAREAIERARGAKTFEAAPGRRDPGPHLRAYPVHDTDDELANKFTDVFRGDERGDRPGEGVEAEPIEPEVVREARKDAGPGERIIIARTGQVQLRDARGRIIATYGNAARDARGRFVTAKILVVGPAPDGSIYVNAATRIISISKSFFQSSGGVSPARLKAGWRGYQRNHPETSNARMEVDGKKVRIKRGNTTLAEVDIDSVGDAES